ncbi:hypothetical protein AXI59_06315 [Bacillus nakamurai]|uniref:hypothetical protein n=1 Tax=Bacillus nakamurai TaxID=1793963 RepID=UPI00077862AE|nr:hypothetical protein [Bacillus nakamurai]KXZ23926.1 hypothetical protein AXI59_06315 [Bacillus nakamurai]
MSLKSKACFHLVLYGLACWTLISLMEAAPQIADYFQTGGSASFELNATPFLLFAACAALYMYAEKKKRAVKKHSLVPDEFEEQDERERMMTAKACRSSYIAVYFSLPAAAVLLLFYPLIQPHLPFFPILLIFILMMIQQLSYVLTFHKHGKNSGS